MASTKGFSVDVSVKDSASGTLDAINKRFASINTSIQRTQAPFTKLTENAVKFSRVTGIDRIGAGLSSVARSGMRAFQSVARIVEPLAAVTGAASIAGMMRLATAWAEFGTQLGNTAARAGLTSDQMMTLQNAGRLAGVSAEALSSGMTGLRDNMVNAVGGKAPQVIGMLQALGMSAGDAGRFAKDTTKALPELADKIAGLKDPTLQAEAATTLFGGAGDALLPFLRKGSAGIAEYTEKARRYGAINADGVAAANSLREAQTSLTLAVEGLGYSIAQKLAPVVTPLLGQMADWIARNRDWIAQGIGDKVQQFADYLKGVDWAKVGNDIGGILHAVKDVVEALGGWIPVGERVLAFFAVSWLAQMLLPIVAVSKMLLKLPGEAAVAAAKSEAELAKVGRGGGLLGTLGKALGYGFLAHEGLSAVDPDDKTGAWIDRNIPGAAAVDNFASRFGLGRSYGQQAEVESAINPNGLGRVPPNASLAGRGVSGGTRRDTRLPSGRNAGGAPARAANSSWAGDLAQLQSYGWSKEQAAGILGNLDQESAGRIDNEGDNKSAYGLGQWHADRQVNFAQQFGHNIRSSTRAEQVAFVNWELNNTERRAGDDLRQQHDARGSAASVRRYYERPLDATGQEDLWRGDRADRMMQLPPEPSGPPLSLPANTGTASNPGAPGQPIASSGQVDIGVRFSNTPPGTTTTAVQSGTGLAPLKVERSMVGGNPAMAY